MWWLQILQPTAAYSGLYFSLFMWKVLMLQQMSSYIRIIFTSSMSPNILQWLAYLIRELNGETEVQPWSLLVTLDQVVSQSLSYLTSCCNDKMDREEPYMLPPTSCKCWNNNNCPVSHSSNTDDAELWILGSSLNHRKLEDCHVWQLGCGWASNRAGHSKYI